MSDKLITIATFNTVAEASIALNRLEAEGVKVCLADGTMSDMAWHLSPAIGGVKVQVMEDDAKFALSLLQDDDVRPIGEEEWRSGPPEGDFEAEAAEAGPDEFTCPADELVNRAYRAAIFGIILLPLQFYSLWLLWRVYRSGIALTAENRRRILVTILVDCWLLVLSVLRVWIGWI